MSGHTKGRLALDEFGDIRTESGDRLRLTGVALAGGNSFFNLAEDNRDRLVALWNAAEELGLTTEAIEAGALKNAFDTLLRVREACLFADDDGGIGVTEDPHIHFGLFEAICAALRTLTQDKPEERDHG